MEMMLWHWDGYAMNRNNFRIYHDRDSDRMVFLPQGVDQILSHPTGPIFRPMAGLVAQAILEVPAGRRQYHERVGQLLTNVFKIENNTNRLHEVGEKIKAALQKNEAERT